MQLDRKRHCHASSWTFALRNFILDRVRGVVRVIVIVVFDDELFWFRSCRVVVEHLSGSASRVDFEIHCFEVPFSCRGFYGMIMSKCNSEAVQNYAMPRFFECMQRSISTEYYAAIVINDSLLGVFFPL